MSPWIGLFGAIFSSTVWAFTSVAFTPVLGEQGPLRLNLIKCVFSGGLFWITTLVLVGLGMAAWPGPSVFWPLFLSGIVGLSLGDYAYFAAIRHCGARQTALLHGTSPLFNVGLSLLLGHGAPTAREGLAIVCILAGVGVVTFWRGKNRVATALPLIGVALGLAAALGQAIGIEIAKIPLTACSPFAGAACRFTGAVAGLVVPLLLFGRYRWVSEVLTDRAYWRRTAALIFVGSFLGMLGMVLAISAAKPAVAGALLSLTPILVIPIARIRLGDRITPTAWFGTVFAVGGVILLATARS